MVNPQSKSMLWKTTRRLAQRVKRRPESFSADRLSKGNIHTVGDEHYHAATNSGHVHGAAGDPTHPQGYDDTIRTKELSLLVGTWNVAGKIPKTDWDLQEWLHLPDSEADIYVLGFQEIVPLNIASIILGGDGKARSRTEDNRSAPAAAKWDALIRRTLNNSRASCNCSCNSVVTTKVGTIAHVLHQVAGTEAHSYIENSKAPSSPPSFISYQLSCKFKEVQSWVVDQILRSHSDATVHRHSFADENTTIHLARLATLDWNNMKQSENRDDGSCCRNCGSKNMPTNSYVRLASKQMVGVFISVWIRRSLVAHVKAVEVSSVGCGLLGCLGNKGSVSVSLSLNHTNFCFVCTHLKSGDHDADAARRNSDVMDILCRTRFPRPRRFAHLNLPKTILAHDRIIWFGDLNYRVSLPCEELKLLVAKQNWREMLQNDQLKMEQSAGRVFEGWREGPIDFAPTYKYLPNSQVYAMAHVKEGDKKRAPAWCDRVLWYGKGLKQLRYSRCESLCHSDHRAVAVLFTAEVELPHLYAHAIDDEESDVTARFHKNCTHLLQKSTDHKTVLHMPGSLVSFSPIQAAKVVQVPSVPNQFGTGLQVMR